MQNLHLRFVLCRKGQIYDGDVAKFRGLLRIYELYLQVQVHLSVIKYSLSTFQGAENKRYGMVDL